MALARFPTASFLPATLGSGCQAAGGQRRPRRVGTAPGEPPGEGLRGHQLQRRDHRTRRAYRPRSVITGDFAKDTPVRTRLPGASQDAPFSVHTLRETWGSRLTDHVPGAAHCGALWLSVPFLLQRQGASDWLECAQGHPSLL